jgi:chemotaxis protein methyltransferase CheR
MTDEQVFEPDQKNLEIHIPCHERNLLDSIRGWIYETTGIDYPPNKAGILYSRLQSLCWRLGIRDIREMERLLTIKHSDWLATEVARAVTTNYTFFFREPDVFDFLRDRILPSLAGFDTWRIWSAASSSGEEAFSVSIMLMEALGQEVALKKAAILGTDISYSMIEQAETGIYSDQRLELLPRAQVFKYFERSAPGMWRISPLVHQMCTFRRMNLKSGVWPFRRPFHVILCRNIFYYFDKTEQVELAERLYDVTEPGGWLLTSVTETFHSMPIRWTRVTAGVWRKCIG